jgi:replicative DNA helicase
MKPDRQNMQTETLDRLPPHSTEAEAAVLGCILLDPANNMAEAATLFPGPEVFYDMRHQAIYWAFQKLVAMNKTIDPVTLLEILSVSDTLEKAGGAAYMSDIPDKAPTPYAFAEYAATVMDNFRLRRMLAALTEATQLIWNRELSPAAGVIDVIEEKVLGASGQHTIAQAKHIKQCVLEVGEQLDNYNRGVGLVSGIRTGFSYLDKVTGGLHNGDVFVLGGRPSTGKTSLLMNMVERIGIDSKVAVGVFSMEMSTNDIALRMMCAMTKSASFHKIRTGFMSQFDYEKLAAAGTALCGANIYLDDTPSLRIDELRARARRLHRRHGIKVVAIDYLQLMRSETRHGENREREVAQISNGLKSLARELNIPVVVLAQLNREFDREGSRKPRLSDLRDSGSIEQDADCVAMLYRPKQEDDAEGNEQTQPVNLFVAKNRNGPTGDVEMVFFREQMRFEDRYQGRGTTEKDLID